MEAKAIEDKAMEVNAMEVKAMEAKAIEAKAMEAKAMKGDGGGGDGVEGEGDGCCSDDGDDENEGEAAPVLSPRSMSLAAAVQTAVPRIILE